MTTVAMVVKVKKRRCVKKNRNRQVVLFIRRHVFLSTKPFHVQTTIELHRRPQKSDCGWLVALVEREKRHRMNLKWVIIHG